MDPKYVSLPPGEFIDCWLLTRCIASAVYPTMETFEGVDCVRVKVHTRIQGNSTSGVPFQTALTQEDRTLLESLLDNLPPVCGWMTDYEIDAFMYEYSMLPNRPNWDPVLVNLAYVSQMESAQLNAQSNHREILQGKLLRKEIQAFDASHAPETRIGPGVWIYRKQAVDYLTECGLSEDINQPYLIENLRVFTASNGRRVTGIFSSARVKSKFEKVPKTTGTGKRWTPEAVVSLREFVKDHSVAEAAMHFEISRQRVEAVLSENSGDASNPEAHVTKATSNMFTQLVGKDKD